MYQLTDSRVAVVLPGVTDMPAPAGQSPQKRNQQLADVAREIVNGASAEFRPRHGTTRIASTREQREE